MKNDSGADKGKLLTKELWGMVLALFSAVVLFCLFTGDAVFYPVGLIFSNFFTRLFGIFAYPLFVFLTVLGAMTVIGKKMVEGKGIVTATGLAVSFLNAFLILQLALVSPDGKTFGEYVSACYNSIGTSVTPGGAVFGILVYGVYSLVSFTGSIVIYSFCFLMGVVISLRDKIIISYKKSVKPSTVRSNDVNSANYAFGESKSVGGAENFSSANAVGKEKKKLFVLGKDSFGLKEETGFGAKSSENLYSGGTYSGAYQGGFASDKDYKKREERVFAERRYEEVAKSDGLNGRITPRENIDDKEDELLNNVVMPKNYTDELGKFTEDGDEVDGIDSDAADDTLIDSSAFDIVDEPKREVKKISETDDFIARRTEAIRAEEERVTQDKTKSGNPYDEMPLNFKYKAPPLELLKDYDDTENYGEVEMFKQLKAEAILNAIKNLSGIETKIVNIVHGPSLTRFDILIPDNASIKSITKYIGDIKLRLQCKNEIRFDVVPGTPYLGLEVPNEKQTTVGLKSVISSEIFTNAKPTSLTFAIGKNLVGDPVVADINKVQHLLVVGATGTGKSVGLNTLLISLMYKYSPEDLRFIIVDPKRVEFTPFSGVPHLLFDEIIYDAPKALAMLDWAINEMEARFLKFSEVEVKNVFEYNTQIDPRKERKMPKIVILIDEFADLMSVEKKNIEAKIARLAQKARAAGIYMILATQRPSVNIIEGSIKNNFGSKLSFKMSSAVDSQTVFDTAGAEKLLGNGDLLYKMMYMSNMERAQGAFISTEEIKQVVRYIKDNNEAYFNEDALNFINGQNAPEIENVTAGGADTNPNAVSKEHLFALYLAVQLGEISISLLQRKMRFGFGRAGAMCDWMERKGYIVDGGTGKRKKVTLTEEKFMELYGDRFSVEEYEDKYGFL